MWRCCIKFKIKPESNICIICHMDLEEESCITLRCRHTYHKTCIRKWAEIQCKVINTSLDNATCPTCRKPFQLKPQKF